MGCVNVNYLWHIAATPSAPTFAAETHGLSPTWHLARNRCRFEMSLPFLAPLKGIGKREEKFYSYPSSDRACKESRVHVTEWSEHEAYLERIRLGLWSSFS